MILRLISILTGLGAICAGIGVILGALQQFHPAFDSFSHFRLHFVAILVLCCAILVFCSSGSRRWVSVAMIFLAGGWFWLEVSQNPPASGPRGDLRVVQFNLNYRNTVMDRVGEALTGYDADVITLQEVPPNHEAVLRALSAYPHQAHCFFRDHVGGVSVLSKHPIRSVDCAEGQGLVSASVDAPGGAVIVASVHTYWPWPFGQHAQVDAWLPRLATLKGPIIVAGDFNAAPWSHAVRKVMDASRTRIVPGIRITIGVKLWSWLPAIPIPIDHVLLSDDLCPTSAFVGPEIGSDHFPVVVEVTRRNGEKCGRS